MIRRGLRDLRPALTREVEESGVLTNQEHSSEFVENVYQAGCDQGVYPPEKLSLADLPSVPDDDNLYL